MIRTTALLLAALAAAPAAAQETPPAATAPTSPVPAETAPIDTAPAEVAPAEVAPAEVPPAAVAPTEAAVTRARELFAKMTAGEAAFDASVADLYCDDALIRNTIVQADGSQRVLEIPAPQYKQLLRRTIPLGASRADRIDYSDVVAVAVDGSVRVTASRHSLRKEAVEPVSLLVGDCAGGGYGIREEITQSSP